jgi:hypothetical protein
MRWPAAIAIVASTGAAAFGLSGCHELLRVTLGGDDPPVHNPPPPGKRSVPAATAAAASGRAFSGRANGKLASRVVLRHGFVKSTMKKVRFIGTFTGKLGGAAVAGDELLGPFTSAGWHGQFSVVRDRRNGKISLSGLVLATATDPAGGRACVRVSYKNARKGKRATSRRKGTSLLTVVGGEGAARTLRGSATVRLTVGRGDNMSLRGRVKARQGPARGFPKACTTLEKKFGLAPLAR